MKYAVLVFFFLVLPYYGLTEFVIPQLEALQTIYADADVIADRAVHPEKYR
jgi:hypothetical protein